MVAIAISARLVIEPGRVDEYLQAAQDVIRHTREEQGCELYAFARDIQQPNVIWISEQWQSDAALQQHFATEHLGRFLKRVADIELLDIDVRKYEVASIGSLTPPPVPA